MRDRLRQMGVEMDDTARSLSEEGPHHICRRGDDAQLHMPALGAGLWRGGGEGEVVGAAAPAPWRRAPLARPQPPLAPWPLAPNP